MDKCFQDLENFFDGPEEVLGMKKRKNEIFKEKRFYLKSELEVKKAISACIEFNKNRNDLIAEIVALLIDIKEKSASDLSALF